MGKDPIHRAPPPAGFHLVPKGWYEFESACKIMETWYDWERYFEREKEKPDAQ